MGTEHYPVLSQVWTGRTATDHPHVPRCVLGCMQTWHLSKDSISPHGPVFLFSLATPFSCICMLFAWGVTKVHKFLGKNRRKIFWKFTPVSRCSWCLFFLRFFIMNVVVFAIGFLSNLEGGFQKSLAFPCAKAGTRNNPFVCSWWKNQQTRRRMKVLVLVELSNVWI